MILYHQWDGGLTVRDDTAEGDGRTLVGLAVPFDTELDVRDNWLEYTEVFRKGAFAKTIHNRKRPVQLRMFHDHHRPAIGRATSLVETNAGLEAAFHLAPTRDADDILTLVADGTLWGLSIGFEPEPNGYRTHKGEGTAGRDLVERTAVILREVSICNDPAYVDAGVVGVRQDQPTHPSLASLAAERGRLETARTAALDRWGRVVRQ